MMGQLLNIKCNENKSIFSESLYGMNSDEGKISRNWFSAQGLNVIVSIS